MKAKALFAGLLALSSVVWASQSHAITLTVGEGWVDDQIDAAGPASEDSPLTFTLTTAGVFSLSDCCNTGDIYAVYGDAFGVSTFTTPTIPIPLGLGDTAYDYYFYDNDYSHLQISLGAGTYSLSVSGDGVGGLPAGFGVRVDSLSAVPLPASAPMFGAALIALGAVGYAAKRKKAAAAA